MIPEKKIEAAYRANDLGDLLNHIAWEEILQPELTKMRENLSKLLVASVLGQAPKTNDGEKISTEQLAGQIYGIDFITNLIKRILKDGDLALKDIQSRGFDLSSS